MHHTQVHNVTMSRPQEDTVQKVARWATKEEVAEHLRVSVKTVQRMTGRGELTAHNVGPRLVRYDLNELDEMLTQETH